MRRNSRSNLAVLQSAEQINNNSSSSSSSSSSSIDSTDHYSSKADIAVLAFPHQSLTDAGFTQVLSEQQPTILGIHSIQNNNPAQACAPSSSQQSADLKTEFVAEAVRIQRDSSDILEYETTPYSSPSSIPFICTKSVECQEGLDGKTSKAVSISKVLVVSFYSYLNIVLKLMCYVFTYYCRKHRQIQVHYR